MRRFWKRRVLASAFALAAAACSGSNSELLQTNPCGPGTVLTSGVCVVSDAGVDGATPGSEDAAADAESEAAPPDPNDACPTSVAINCSDSCGGQTDNCSKATCGAKAGVLRVRVASTSELPIMLRTPSKPGRDPNCPTDCGRKEPVPVYAMAMEFLIDRPGDGYRLRVDPPWRVAYFNYNTTTTFCPIAPDKCAFQNDRGSFFMVFTEDPEAPARNVYLEAVKPDEQCP